VERQAPEPGRLEETLRRLGFQDRLPAVAAAGEYQAFGKIFFARAGLSGEEAREVLARSAGRSHLPEGLRLAHLIGQGLALGESKGAP
jgi:endonuclease V-like protein UPF0215 family